MLRGGEVAQIHGKKGSLFFGVLADDNHDLLVYEFTKWTPAALDFKADLPVTVTPLRTTVPPGGGGVLFADKCPTATIETFGMECPPPDGVHYSYMCRFMAAHNVLESGTHWPFSHTPHPAAAWVAAHRKRLKRLRSVMYAAMLFNAGVGLRYKPVGNGGLHRMWKTATKPLPRIFPAVQAGGPAWKIADKEFLNPWKKNSGKPPWDDWTLASTHGVYDTHDITTMAEFKPKWQRVNQMVYFNKFGKLKGMDMQIKSLSSANGTQVGIMAVMVLQRDSFEYVQQADEIAFMRNSMPPLCRLIGIMLGQELIRMLAEKWDAQHYTLVGADLPLFYMYLHDDSGELCGCWSDALLKSGNRLFCIELKSRWLDELKPYDRRPDQTAHAAYTTQHGYPATVKQNHIQAYGQTMTTRAFFGGASTRGILLAVNVPGAQHPEDIGFYSTSWALNKKKEQAYQATVLLQRWGGKNAHEAYADDMVVIPANSNAMLYAVLAQFEDQSLYFKRTGGEWYKVSLAGPHRVQSAYTVLASKPKNVPHRCYTRERDGRYVCAHTSTTMVKSATTSKATSLYRETMQAHFNKTTGTRNFIHFLACAWDKP